MRSCDRLLLMSPDRDATTLDMSPHALVDALIEDPPLVTPGWRIRHGDNWLTLPEHPDRPWLDVLQQRAVTALRGNEPDQTEFLCRRILEHARSVDQHFAVQSAQFLLARLETVFAQWPSAAERLKSVTSGSLRFQACVQNNLAHVQCLLGQPLLACQLWLAAATACPELVTAWLSLRNIAEVMLDEGERRHPQLPSWNELRRQADEALAKLTPADIDRWLRPDAQFPAYESLSVFFPGRYSPPLSSYFAPDDTGESAGRQLLADATSALAARHPELAETLASRAAAECPKLAVPAQEIASQAGRMRVERERTLEAQRFQRLLDRFDRELERLTIDDLEAPTATLDLIESLLGPGPVASGCRPRYQRRVVELCRDAAEASEGEERARWLERLTLDSVPRANSASS